MKHILLYPRSFLILALTLIVGITKAQERIYISEIMYDSPLNEQIATGIAYSNGEYIGIGNKGSNTVDLSGWKLCGGGKTEIYTIPQGVSIRPDTYIIVAYQYNNSNFLLTDLYQFNGSSSGRQIFYQRKILLSNSGEAVCLKDASNLVRDSIYYDGTSHKTKPDRLFAENADSISGSECQSLQRIDASWDAADRCITNNADWVAQTVTLLSGSSGPSGSAPARNYSIDHNYVLTRTMLDEDGTRYSDDIQYYDGLGRPSQHIQVGVTPEGNDLVTLQEYDTAGREIRQWIPTPFAGNGAYVDGFTSQASAKHNGDNYPYSETEYEATPLNRVLKQTGPGKVWHTNGKGVQTHYLTNTASGNLKVTNYSVNSSGGLVKNGIYETAQLYCNEITDEDGNKTYTFTDKSGRELLTRQMNGTEPHDTYYVYDDFGNLCYVLPPMINDNISADNLNKYAYQYKYDGRNRQIERKLPGCEPVYQVYDRSDRLVLSQDGNQRQRGVWLVNKYDVLGRLLYTSEVEERGDVNAIRNSFSAWLVTESFTTENQAYPQKDTGYSKGFYHQAPTKLLTVNYYDDYRFLELLSEETKGMLDYTVSITSHSRYENSKGLLTGTRTYHLDGGNAYTAEAYYYDERGNVIQKRSTNHLGGCDAHYYEYTFTGKLLEDFHHHDISRYRVSYGETTSYVYDHAERVTETNYSGMAQQIASTSSYDELGRLKQKTINNGMETVAYNYDIRNQLTAISSPAFTETVYYHDGSWPAYYNGNIGRINTKVRNEEITREYFFTYDGLSRMKKAAYGYETPQLGVSADFYTVKVDSYDKHGNIEQLTRYGYLTPQRIQTRIVNPDDTPTVSPYGIIDDLSLSYDGNQLKKVTDVSENDPVYKDVMHFVDGSDDEVEYTYDANGNLLTDKNKGLLQITYNTLNLPRRIRGYELLEGIFVGQPYVTEPLILNTYTADGVKISTTYGRDFPTPEGITISMREAKVDYCDNFIYENDTLSRVLIADGYIDCKSYRPATYFYLKDHQGNNRVVLGKNDSIMQVNHYYPFGALFGESKDGGLQKYKYNGKELERMYELDLYDYGARWMDPILGRFTTPDPLCEKYYSVSPYAYCANNPINRIDPDGRRMSPIYNISGRLLGTDDEGLQGEALFMSENDFSQGMKHEDALKINKGVDLLKDNPSVYRFLDSFLSLSNRPDYDGKLTLKEANDWYQNGNGKPLYVDASKINLSPLHIEDLEIGKTQSFNFASPKYANFETGLVYGHLSLTLLEKNGAVKIGQNNLFDNYGFEMHDRGIFRNIATKIGNIWSVLSTGKNQGKPYNIYGYGFNYLKK